MKGDGPARAWLTWARSMPCTSALFGAFILSLLLQWTIDRPLAFFMRDIRDTSMGHFFAFVTEIGLGWPWYIGFLLAVLVCMSASKLALTMDSYDVWRARTRRFSFALTALVASGLAVTLLKQVFGRYRPKMLFAEDLYGFAPFSGNTSFPSGHAQVIFASMAALWFLFPRWRLIWGATACLVGFSRVVVTAHYLSDIVMGGTLAIVVTIGVHRWFEQNRTTPLTVR
ncbi:phosphatase PAP2 family protein [Haematospirillum sp. H1815]|uniref:phosphatase PAP2 family protein n=1 Tax=Haematospirillum sp. H1815 TaxID=2723108 RepID=UPI00143AD386|nr:phosphatase PAP2 family protein [Haematospirillum sp. H1815]NKD77030.1 phosphatase PAP2 family protein [Haematospirillum sp. H1815]